MKDSALQKALSGSVPADPALLNITSMAMTSKINEYIYKIFLNFLFTYFH